MSNDSTLEIDGIKVTAPVSDAFREILTDDALKFVATLVREFGERRVELLARREEVQKQLDAGQLPDFLPETEDIRNSDWKISPTPPDLQDRRVEITGPVDRKMVINALNSGAKMFMADLEDSHSPTWEACIEGQINLRDAVNRTIEFKNPNGKEYKLNEAAPSNLRLRTEPMDIGPDLKKALLETLAHHNPLYASLEIISMLRKASRCIVLLQ